MGVDCAGGLSGGACPVGANVQERSSPFRLQQHTERPECSVTRFMRQIPSYYSWLTSRLNAVNYSVLFITMSFTVHFDCTQSTECQQLILRCQCTCCNCSLFGFMLPYYSAEYEYTIQLTVRTGLLLIKLSGGNKHAERKREIWTIIVVHGWSRFRHVTYQHLVSIGPTTLNPWDRPFPTFEDDGTNGFLSPKFWLFDCQENH